jgi:hypothetical protein
VYLLKKVDKDNMNDKLNQLNEEILSWWKGLKSLDESTWNDYACPYLITVSEEYINAKLKVLLVGKETFGWGDGKEDFSKTIEDRTEITVADLTNLYRKFVIDGWGWIGESQTPFWRHVENIRGIGEGDNPNEYCVGKVGIAVSNVALLGWRYEERFDTRLEQKLTEFLRRQLDILSPDLILFSVGLGSSSNKDYERVLKGVFRDDIRSNYRDDWDEETHFTMLGEVRRQGEKPQLLYSCCHPQYKSCYNKIYDKLFPIIKQLCLDIC